MVYLERNPDVLQNADMVIVEYMSDGLTAANPWPGYYVFPDHKPWLLTSYIFRRNVLAPLLGRISSDCGSVPATGTTDAAQLQRFKMLISSVSSKRSVVIFMYPMRFELRDRSGWLEATAAVRNVCQENSLTCIDVAREPTWGESAYKRDGVHPTVAGNKALASILAKAVTNKSAL